MTVTEQVGGVAKSAIENLRGSPNCMVALLLVALMAILTFLHMQKESDRLQVRQMAMLERCYPLQGETNDGRN